MKKVRILLRVSSNQQLDADGDLNVQRDIIKEYISQHEDWVLDESDEYFEGGVSGYKNAIEKRNVLQAALIDAQKHQYDILCCYKDDRIGRRMWEIGAYVMQLKEYGVDIYTVKDGCISPNGDDIMGQMMLALRYGNAQKSSSDTGMRVKDTAQKLVQQGKFMGGKAPFGYELVHSGEISKHGRALKKPQIIPEQAEIVKEIYAISLEKEYGSAKIARLLNTDERYKDTAPNDVWKAGTITSILTNPLYAGLTAYKRREKTNGKYHKLGSDDWIYAKEVNTEIAIIDIDTWNEVQRKRKLRSNASKESNRLDESKIIRENKGSLALIDVLYCGECGGKMTNGTRYNYWELKNGDKCHSKYGIYKCQQHWQGVPHKGSCQYKADDIEEYVFEQINRYIDSLLDNDSVFAEISKNNQQEKKSIEKKLSSIKKEIEKINDGIKIMKDHLPDAIMGTYSVSADILSSAIEQHESNRAEKEKELQEIQNQIDNMSIEYSDWDRMQEMLPTWKETLANADKATKRALVNRLIERITITKDEIRIKFKIDVPPTIKENYRIGECSVVQK